MGLCHLIQPRFAKVLLTEAVVSELRAKHAGDADQIEHAISLAEIISLAHPPDPLLIAELDPGERKSGSPLSWLAGPVPGR